jgi:hypothetical protein
VAALLRPADGAFGEDEAAWVERAKAASALGPIGHHTHWTAPDHARPTSDSAGSRVLVEGTRIREHDVRATLFCGGGWYTDPEVADACAELGYVDCTPRAHRPPYLSEGEPWASLAAPAVVVLPTGRELGSIPTTHSLGDLARALSTRALPGIVHVYFHDTDLLDRRRRVLVHAVLRALAWRAHVTDLDALAVQLLPEAPRIAWDDVTRL